MRPVQSREIQASANASSPCKGLASGRESVYDLVSNVPGAGIITCESSVHIGLKYSRQKEQQHELNKTTKEC